MRRHLGLWMSCAALVAASSLMAAPASFAAPPTAPQNVQAEPGSTGGTAVVRWSAATPADDSVLLGYTVEARDSSGNAITSSRTDAPASSTGPVTISNLTNGASYTFVVYSRYSTGSVRSDPSATVIPFTVPASPTAPTATRLSAGSVRLSWTAPSDDGGRAISSYTVTCTPVCTPTTVTGLTTDLAGLTTSTSYTFKVAATNARGSSTPSPASQAVIPYGAPGAPQSVSGTRGNAQLTISWQAPQSDGGSTITGYTATATPSGKQCTWSSGPLQCIITGLDNGQSYSVSVTASNANETPSPAGTASNLVPATVPNAPVASASAGNQQATVSWSVPADGGSAITGYTATSAAGGKTCTAGANETSCVVTGLVNGTSYQFRVTASNAVGTGTASNLTAAVTPSSPVSRPGVVKSLTAVRTGSGTATVTWQAPDDTGGAAISQYELQFRIGNSGSWSNADDTTAPGVRTYGFTGLTNGSSYFFRVAARNSAGLADWVSTQQAVIPGTVPGKVTGVNATPGSGQVALAWTAPSGNGYAILDYRVEYKLASAANWTLIDDTSTATSFTVTGLANDSAYQFRIRAHNQLGSGDYSDTASATPTASSASPTPSPTGSASPTTSPSPTPSPTTSPTATPSPSPTGTPTTSPTPRPTPSPDVEVPKRVVTQRGETVKVVLDPSGGVKASSLKAFIVVNDVRRALEATFRTVRGDIVMTFKADRKPGSYPVLIGQAEKGKFAVLGQTRLVIKGRRSSRFR